MAFYSYIRWELDEWAVVGLVILFILEALILWLLLNSAQRKRFERESKRLALLATEGHSRLDEVVSNVPGIVWESRLEPGGNQRRETFISQQLKNVLGYSVEVHPDDREFVRDGWTTAFNSLKPYNAGISCAYKDRRLRGRP